MVAGDWHSGRCCLGRSLSATALQGLFHKGLRGFLSATRIIRVAFNNRLHPIRIWGCSVVADETLILGQVWEIPPKRGFEFRQFVALGDMP
jgi:hypothetical protein